MTSLFMNNQAERYSTPGFDRRDWMQIGGSLLGGLGIGAIAMYLLDPQAGERRRRQLAQVAAEAGDQLGQLGTGVLNAAESATGSVGSMISDVADRAMDAVSDSNLSAGYLADRVAESMNTQAHSTSIAAMVFTCVGCAVVGAGLMFILDPDAGHRRRIFVRDKTLSAAHRANKKIRGKGKHYGRMVRGVYHEASDAVKQATGQERRDQNLAWTTDPQQITNPQ